MQKHLFITKLPGKKMMTQEKSTLIFGYVIRLKDYVFNN